MSQGELEDHFDRENCCCGCPRQRSVAPRCHLRCPDLLSDPCRRIAIATVAPRGAKTLQTPRPSISDSAALPMCPEACVRFLSLVSIFQSMRLLYIFYSQIFDLSMFVEFLTFLIKKHSWKGVFSM